MRKFSFPGLVSQSFVYKKETPVTPAQNDKEGDDGYHTYTAIQKPDVSDAEQKLNNRDALYDNRILDQSLEQSNKNDEDRPEYVVVNNEVVDQSNESNKNDEDQPEYVVLNKELADYSNEEDNDNKTGEFDPVYFQLERAESTKEDQSDKRRDSAPEGGSDNNGYLDVKEFGGPAGEYDTLARVGKVNSMKVETATASSHEGQLDNRRDSAAGGGSDNYGYLDVKEINGPAGDYGTLTHVDNGPAGEYDTLARVGKVNSMKEETATVTSDDTYNTLVLH